MQQKSGGRRVLIQGAEGPGALAHARLIRRLDAVAHDSPDRPLLRAVAWHLPPGECPCAPDRGRTHPSGGPGLDESGAGAHARGPKSFGARSFSRAKAEIRGTKWPSRRA